ncbi:TPA: RHS repeat-associated core domain-containing protein [Salmonella enterica]|uniref:RHS repeat-associated core domain-containing protein n=2 Tax=Salmonella enterica TaxID=28901 RepID=A0A745MN02_SALER|nr:type IV secretion protein Rhs [Salmonella enterica subsp. enterica serovar Choleraesuis]AXQ03416.1 RHS repeat-associated core domain-containing protein [Salmonella enterica subsp. enterica serovar Choleraesuis str. ATCC 10708]EAW5242127.1 RHS repeat-associated core domain-containing protein [Salmonella enterica]EBA0169278.1 RHS repeat-associated core domain-containing protein [Salmonella enterica subsp. enterica serovar Enteritidis]EBX2441975.1 RHS repeat-associated core domain-containing pr
MRKYGEWGNLSGEENPVYLEQVIRLPGQQYDKESGLYYNRHRYYNPGQGRYITQDSIGLSGGLNPYTYPLNPVVNIDPLGLVNINLFPENQYIHDIADHITIPGVFTVGVHGSPLYVEDASGNPVDVKKLADMIRKDRNYRKGKPIKLISCNTAKGGEGSFASQLAKELNVNVTGPDTLWSVWWENDNSGIPQMDSVLTAPTDSQPWTRGHPTVLDEKDRGNWVTFGPDGNEISSVKSELRSPQR